MADNEYPEHEKLHKIKDESWAIGEFLEWLPTIGIHLAQWVCPGHLKPFTLDEWFHDTSDECDNPLLVYAHKHVETLLAEHFKIDLDVLETEKRAMLEAQRALNERVASHVPNEEGT